MYSYDKFGRILRDAAGSFGSGVDNTIKKLEFAWDRRGRFVRATSYSGTTTIANETSWAYNDFNQPITEYPAHGGAVNTGTTPKVQYGYASGSSNTIRPASVTSPNYTGITNLQQKEMRSFDETGNWLSDYTTSPALNQTRTHNKANETINLTGPTTVIGPMHSAVGNMTTLPQPGAWTTSCALKQLQIRRAASADREDHGEPRGDARLLL